MSTQFLVGTASLTDPTLVKSDLFYPPTATTPAERLAFYAAQFPTVEVDSLTTRSSERNAALWVQRTPARFVFNIKAFSWLTQHTAETSRPPNAINELLPESILAAARIKTPPYPVLELAFQMFWSALQPLRAASKLGYLLFQFRPYSPFDHRTSSISRRSRIGWEQRRSQSSFVIRAGSAQNRRIQRR
jgi:uncharacterized protein YecE (DUF72 family)